MFKVLVIAYYFPPMGLSGVQRTLKFVKYLKQFNWQPVVITSGNVGYYAHDVSLDSELKSLDIKVIRVSGKEPNALLAKYGTVEMPREWIRRTLSFISQCFFIPDNKISWAAKVYDKASEILSEDQFDAIFVTAPPFSAFRMAARLKKKFNIPLFADYRDMWYDSYLSVYPTPLHRLLNKKYEYNALRAAENVFVTNRRIKEWLLNTYKFLSFDDVVIIPHGYDPEDFENIQTEPKLNRKLRLVHSGIFYHHNTPKFFLKAFRELVNSHPAIAKSIELHFIGHLGKHNHRVIKKLKLEEYVFDHGYLPHSEAVRKICSADVLWMMLGRWKHAAVISPGKVYEYIGSGKPIIGCVPEGAARTVLEEYKASFICEPDDINSIKEILVKVYKLYTEQKLPTPDEDALIKYRRDHLTEQLAKQLQFHLKEKVI
ncbi:MAG: glycosyltransferase family 4 protein [Ignavibacteriaceae bacterium]